MRGSSKIQLNSAKVATATPGAPPRKTPKARAASRTTAGAQQHLNGAATLSHKAARAGESTLSDPRLDGTECVPRAA